jgi:hypothetical protein
MPVRPGLPIAFDAIMYGASQAASHAAQVYHRQPVMSVLRPPTVISVASGVTSMVVPYQFNLAPPTPEGTPHAPPKKFTFTKLAAKPRVEPVSKPDAGNAAEVLLVIVVIVVVAERVYVRVVDAAGRVLARIG